MFKIIVAFILLMVASKSSTALIVSNAINTRRNHFLSAKSLCLDEMRVQSSNKRQSSTRTLDPLFDSKSRSSGAEGHTINLTSGYTQLSIIALLSSLAEAISFSSAFKHQPLLPIEAVLKAMLKVASQLVVFKASDTLRSASERNRLDGNTFKLLNVGFMLSSIAGLYSLYRPFPPANPRVIVILKFLSCIMATILSAVSIRSFGLPELKVDIRNPLALSHAATVFLLIFSSSGITPGLGQGYWAELDIKIVLGLISVALAGAATAGPKRMSSDTYLGLNAALAAYSLVQISARAYFAATGFDSVRNVFLFVPMLVSSVFSWLRGYIFKTGTKKDATKYMS